MIERTEVKGRDAYLAYLDDDMQPVDKDEATLVKVIFADNNETMWLVPATDDDAETDDEEEAEDALDQEIRDWFPLSALDGAIAAFFAHDAEFKEAEHPRKKTGEFTKKGTGEASEDRPAPPRLPSEMRSSLKDHGFRRSKPDPFYPEWVEFTNSETGEEFRVWREGKDIEWQLGRQEDKYTWANVSSGTGLERLQAVIEHYTVIGKSRQAEKAKARAKREAEQEKIDAAAAEKRRAAAGPGWSSGSLRVEEASEISSLFKASLSDALDAIPSGVRDRLSEFGCTVRTGAFMTDVDPTLSRGVTPRGWPQGSTWDQADGMYSIWKKQVICTEFTRFGTLTEPGRGKSVMFHESGHAFDGALGDMSQTERFTTVYDRDAAAIPQDMRGRLAYFLQSGEAGRQETFAEAFSWEMGKGPSNIDIRQYFPGVTELVRDAIKQPQSITA